MPKYPYKNMEIIKRERVSIFIDGSNLYHSLAGIKIDFEKLIIELVNGRCLVNAFYYIAPLDITANEERYWKHQKFLAELEKIAKFKIILCTLRRHENPSGNSSFDVKGDDVFLANDVLVGAYENLYDTAILVSGDEDFLPVINTLKRLKKKTENAFFIKTSSKKLRKNCDKATNISTILDKIKLEK